VTVVKECGRIRCIRMPLVVLAESGTKARGKFMWEQGVYLTQKSNVLVRKAPEQ